MNKAIAVVMDPIEHIQPSKDTSLALLLEAQRRGYQLHYVLPGSLAIADNQSRATVADLSVNDDKYQYFKLGEPRKIKLAEMDVVLMRKDPPVDAQFIHDTQILSMAEAEGVLVVNRAQGLRDWNEKLAALQFPQCCPETLVSRNVTEFKDFIAAQGDVVVKPLDGMGGKSIFRIRQGESNANVILETLTADGKLAMAQRYLPEIRDGDKRILMVDGQPVPYALARIPQGTEFRGNLAAGGRGEGRALTDRDRWIAGQVGPWLKAQGLLFVGLDVIGDYLTEINVTSPTCARELDAQFGLNIAGLLFDAIESRLGHL
jgi:glutathione synthase